MSSHLAQLASLRSHYEDSVKLDALKTAARQRARGFPRADLGWDLEESYFKKDCQKAGIDISQLDGERCSRFRNAWNAAYDCEYLPEPECDLEGWPDDGG